MPGEWDMMLTLLRLAVQAGARRLYCEPALFEQGEIAIVAARPTAALIEHSSLQRIEYGGMGLGRSAMMMQIIRLAERTSAGWGKGGSRRGGLCGCCIIRTIQTRQNTEQ